MKKYRTQLGALLTAGLLAFSAVPYTLHAESTEEEMMEEEEDIAEDVEEAEEDPAASAETVKTPETELQGGTQADTKGLISDSGSSSGGGLPDGLSIASEVQAADPENQKPMVTVDPSRYPAASFGENAREVYWYCRLQLGLNHAAACGVLANVHLESSFRPLALGDGGTSYGICQWHLGRLTSLMSWCEANDLDYNTLEGQLPYLSYELSSRYTGFYEALKQVEDTPEGARYAGWLMCVSFEMPDQADARGWQRGNLAMNNYYPKNFFETASFTTLQKVFVKAEATAVSEDTAVLAEETEVTLTDIQNGWAEISYEQDGSEQTGWIPAKLLQHVKEADALVVPENADTAAEEQISSDTSREETTEADEEDGEEEDEAGSGEDAEEAVTEEELREDGSQESGI